MADEFGTGQCIRDSDEPGIFAIYLREIAFLNGSVQFYTTEGDLHVCRITVGGHVLEECTDALLSADFRDWDEFFLRVNGRLARLLHPPETGGPATEDDF